MSRPTGFFLHPAAPLHDPGWGHPEHQGRLRALSSTVGKDLLTLHGRVEMGEHRSATDEELARVHAPAHVDRVRAACDRAEEEDAIVALDHDTRVSGASWEAATGSAGTAVGAATAVARGEYRSAFVATRPPGHHATPTRPMGFCLFNSVAVAARALQAEGLADRVLIVDWDVHHGNGTQDVFWEDDSVFFLSVHQWPWYPGTGAADERGGGAGEGHTLNVPLPGGVSVERWRSALEEALEAALAAGVPDFVLVSAGFDCMAGDPLGDFPLEPVDLHAVTERLVQLAQDCCEGRIACVLEGGYEPARLGAGAVAVIRALAGLEAPA